MDSISKDCNELKKLYDACFNTWFSEQFLKNRGGAENKCQDLFQEYRKCVTNAIQKSNIQLWEVERDILGTDKEKRPPPLKEETNAS